MSEQELPAMHPDDMGGDLTYLRSDVEQQAEDLPDYWRERLLPWIAEIGLLRAALEQILWRADASDAGSVVAGRIAAAALGRGTVSAGDAK